MGIANTTSAAALATALYGGGAARWVGPGTGIAGVGLTRKIAVVEQGVALHQQAAKDGFDLLRRLGGRELAAMVGAIIAARIARVPVLLDGYASSAAAATLLAVDAQALDHCLVAHCSAEPGHRLLLEHLGKPPLLDFGMRLGEASGATLAIAIVKAALACHNGMATFAQAGVSGKDAPER
jgi:nicotinate-nucleotide--dimethylbenzimidazole phosphoribosyltransferase